MVLIMETMSGPTWDWLVLAQRGIIGLSTQKQRIAGPADLDHSTAGGVARPTGVTGAATIGKRKRGTRPFQQRLGDKQSQAHSLIAGPARTIF